MRVVPQRPPIMNRLEERVADQLTAVVRATSRGKPAGEVTRDFLSALEAQGLKIVPVEPIETAPKWPQKFLAYFPAEYGEPAFISITADCPERGPMIGAVEPTFWFPQARAAMLNAVEG